MLSAVWCLLPAVCCCLSSAFCLLLPVVHCQVRSVHRLGYLCRAAACVLTFPRWLHQSRHFCCRRLHPPLQCMGTEVNSDVACDIRRGIVTCMQVRVLPSSAPTQELTLPWLLLCLRLRYAALVQDGLLLWPAHPRLPLHGTGAAFPQDWLCKQLHGTTGLLCLGRLPRDADEHRPACAPTPPRALQACAQAAGWTSPDWDCGKCASEPDAPACSAEGMVLQNRCLLQVRCARGCMLARQGTLQRGGGG